MAIWFFWLVGFVPYACMKWLGNNPILIHEYSVYGWRGPLSGWNSSQTSSNISLDISLAISRNNWGTCSILAHHSLRILRKYSPELTQIRWCSSGGQGGIVRATVGRAARTSGRARTSRGSKGLVYYEIIDYIINAPSRGSEEERMGIPCWWRYI